MSVPLASLSNITKLVETIAQHLSANAAAHLSLAPRSSAPTLRKEEVETPNAKEEASPEISEDPIPSRT
jgi:hypothetical protein